MPDESHEVTPDVDVPWDGRSFPDAPCDHDSSSSLAHRSYEYSYGTEERAPDHKAWFDPSGAGLPKIPFGREVDPQAMEMLLDGLPYTDQQRAHMKQMMEQRFASLGAGQCTPDYKLMFDGQHTAFGFNFTAAPPTADQIRQRHRDTVNFVRNLL